MSRPIFDKSPSATEPDGRVESFDVDRSDNANDRKLQASIALGIALIIDVGVVLVFIIAGSFGGNSDMPDFPIIPSENAPSFNDSSNPMPEPVSFKDRQFASLLRDRLMQAYYSSYTDTGTPPNSMNQIAGYLDDGMRAALIEGKSYNRYYFFYYAEHDPVSRQHFASFTAMPSDPASGASAYYITNQSSRVYAIDSMQLQSEPRYVITNKELENDPSWRAID